jgi:hypothetical protein
LENRITQALTKLFERHRIVFWYDTKGELRSDFEAVSIPDVEKLEIAMKWSPEFPLCQESCRLN